MDCVIFSVGQKPEDLRSRMGLELTHGPYILADETSGPAWKASGSAGDVVTGIKSFIEAIAAGPQGSRTDGSVSWAGGR